MCPQCMSRHPPSPGEDAPQLWCTQPTPPDSGTARLAGGRGHTMLAGLSAGRWGASLTRRHTVRVGGVLLLRQSLWGDWSRHPVSSVPLHSPQQRPLLVLHPSRAGLRHPLVAGEPSSPSPVVGSPCRAVVRIGRTPRAAPGARCSPRPVFPRLVRSSPMQHLSRAVRNHHLIQVHLARHHRGGGGFHPAHCWTAGFLYHLWRQPPAATQNGFEGQGYLPRLSTLPSRRQSQAEPQGERSWSL